MNHNINKIREEHRKWKDRVKTDGRLRDELFTTVSGEPIDELDKRFGRT